MSLDLSSRHTSCAPGLDTTTLFPNDLARGRSLFPYMECQCVQHLKQIWLWVFVSQSGSTLSVFLCCIHCISSTFYQWNSQLSLDNYIHDFCELMKAVLPTRSLCTCGYTANTAVTAWLPTGMPGMSFHLAMSVASRYGVWSESNSCRSAPANHLFGLPWVSVQPVQHLVLSCTSQWTTGYTHHIHSPSTLKML